MLKVRLPNTPYCRPLLTLPYIAQKTVEVALELMSKVVGFLLFIHKQGMSLSNLLEA